MLTYLEYELSPLWFFFLTTSVVTWSCDISWEVTRNDRHSRRNGWWWCSYEFEYLEYTLSRILLSPRSIYGFSVLLFGILGLHYYYLGFLGTFASIQYRIAPVILQLAAPILLPFFLCMPRKQDFLQMERQALCVMVAYVASITYCVGFIPTLLLWFNMSLVLHITYAQTSWWTRCISSTLVILSCAKILTYYLGVMWLLWTTMLYIGVYFYARKLIDPLDRVFLSGKPSSDSQLIPQTSVRAFIQFLQHRGHVFLAIMLLSVLCTFGQLGMLFPFEEPGKTIANVFCKVDQINRLQYLVKVSFSNRSGLDGHCKNNSQEWGFCGMLFTL